MLQRHLELSGWSVQLQGRNKRVRPEAIAIRVEPVSTTPAAFEIIVSPVPYCIDMSTAHNVHGGHFLVTGLFQN